MGYSLIVNNADFSNAYIGSTKLHKIPISVDYEGKVFSGYGTDTLSFVDPDNANSTWAKSSRISQEINIPSNIKYIYGVIPIIVQNADIDNIIENSGTGGAVTGDKLYYYLAFNVQSGNSSIWRYNNTIWQIYDIYAIRKNIFYNHQFSLLLANFRLANFASTVHKFRVQWQCNAGDSKGIGMETPLIYYEDN
jgi:hypothetical protein